MSTAGGALTRVRSCQGRFCRVRTRAGRAWSTWEVTGRGSNWDGAAVSGSDDRRGSKGHAWPLPQRDSRCKYVNWGRGRQGALVVPKDESDPWQDRQGLGVKECGAPLSWWWVEARRGAHARVWTLQVCRPGSERRRGGRRGALLLTPRYSEISDAGAGRPAPAAETWKGRNGQWPAGCRGPEDRDCSEYGILERCVEGRK